MASDYSTAVIPEPFTVLGRRLKPFTVGHQILLERFGSNYALGSKEGPGFSDLILSVFICSRTYEEVLRDVQAKLTPLKLKLWGWYCGTFDVGEAMRFFWDYLDAHTKGPDFWTEKGSGKPQGAPIAQSIKVKLQKELGYSEPEALNTPYSIALWNYITAIEDGVHIKILTEEDRRAIAAANDPELAQKVQAIADAINRKR